MVGPKAFTSELNDVDWPENFKPSTIEKYDGAIEPTQWLGVYQLAIRAAGCDSYVMANYLLMCLSPNVLTWLMAPPSRSIDSWGDLYRQLINNFSGTCNRPSSKWDLERINQREDESI